MTLTSSYIRLAVYSTVVDWTRKKGTPIDLVPISHELESQLAEGLVVGPSPEDMAEQEGIRRALFDALGELKEDRRMAVALYLQGHTARETASILGWSVKRAQNLVSRGKADLKSHLLKKGVTV